MKKYFERWYVAAAWVILIQVLLCLPGSALPETDLFDGMDVDKFIHVLLFGGAVWLWCFFLKMSDLSFRQLNRGFFLIYLAAAANGILLEFVQDKFIPNRSFDTVDIIADLSGASLAYGICNLLFLHPNHPHNDKAV